MQQTTIRATITVAFPENALIAPPHDLIRQRLTEVLTRNSNGATFNVHPNNNIADDFTCEVADTYVEKE